MVEPLVWYGAGAGKAKASLVLEGGALRLVAGLYSSHVRVPGRQYKGAWDQHVEGLVVRARILAGAKDAAVATGIAC